MTRKVLTVALAVLALAAGSVAAADRSSGTGTATLGQFAAQVVTSLGLDARDPAVLRESLRTLGYLPGADLSAPLTAGAAHRLATDLGVSVTAPADPAATLSDARAAALAGYIATVFVEAGAMTSSDVPTQCLSSVNRGACVNCCKDATGLTGQFCGRFCHANVPPPPSPDEPQP